MHFVGVDVGTGSTRACVSTIQGKILATSVHPIQTWNPKTDHYEQSSDDIWESVCKTIKEALAKADLTKADIAGIGFDATCSLVVLDEEDRPVTVSTTGKDAQNIILWMDHRAHLEAEEINATQHEVLKYVGGTISPEMECPKLVWLKKHLPDTWNRAHRFLDLADYLTYRATSDDMRSLCTVVCKWTFQGHLYEEGKEGWSQDFFEKIGLGDLLGKSKLKIGERIGKMGESLGTGLGKTAAEELGLNQGTAVSVGIIDAHAGGIGLLGGKLGNSGEISPKEMETRMAVICGTSTCYMAVSQEPKWIKGIWGPYFSAMVPNMWLTEGGQSATGSLVDHVIRSHASYDQIRLTSVDRNVTVYDILNEILYFMKNEQNLPAVDLLTRDIHVLPYHHGNRSPRADPTLTGSIVGLTLDGSVNHLALQYLATIQAIAYGTRHVIEEMNDKGYSIQDLFMTGGLLKNPIFVEQHANATQCRVIRGGEPESVLLGSAILGAVAAGAYASVLDAMTNMTSVGEITNANHGMTKFHDAKYRIFLKMYEDQMSYRNIMKGV
eukprot:TRINITY_DN3704_c0_g1_i1.p1 TRINITY_DN3704_c0_g1~~TRINITY_DN3704_c0_g1_i1.p1  ORF type:complete len:552 (+),score=152.68 TRINITY_DN3704_c0_g1_i1:1-1656(+)